MLGSFAFFFQAEDGIRDLVRSRGLGDVYKRQVQAPAEVDAVGGLPGPHGLADIPGALDDASADLVLSLIHI